MVQKPGNRVESLNAFNRLLGIRVLEETPDGARAELVVRPEFFNSMEGIVHGGVVATLLDVVMGHAAAPHQDGVQQSVTAEFKVNFLRPATGERLVAASRIVKRGRRLVVATAEAYGGDGALVAVALGTYALRGEVGR
ncbi:PaaI family thioesterase [Hydrogenibacillus schlegelii]|uniref:Phenylacetic acid degradation protein n=1 Tax=Hydrogenibacillus schlegelii TaxID=1484 RepID=A0A132MG09_HYDSH|nr:PaaI family thioesterase [Hydrogenibacillus schlegelii]KWW96705.1 phenylacetic acid degradation protein [Hydrogenibacillus schlegelii]OAR05330.1 phenylacetic acid degradation protein [Hydrogenibacillus schlegelii]PTQ52322.1 MAG: Phenylacetic acid degradation protein paaI [Hydrogenibacillus schlegelii]